MTCQSALRSFLIQSGHVIHRLPCWHCSQCWTDSSDFSLSTPFPRHGSNGKEHLAWCLPLCYGTLKLIV